MAWFESNQTDEFARTLLYIDFPEYYTWQKNEKRWQRRRDPDRYSIGRMHFAPPTTGERFYLRLLLTVVWGATSFEYLRTVEGESEACNTFQEACLKRGLLQDDEE